MASREAKIWPRRILWFVALWLASVALVTLVAVAIRSVLL